VGHALACPETIQCGVAIEAHRWPFERRAGRYTSELSLALARSFPGRRVLSGFRSAVPDAAGGPPNLKRGGGPRNATERRWWLWGLAREMSRLGADLVHGHGFRGALYSAPAPACSRCTISPRG